MWSLMPRRIQLVLIIGVGVAIAWSLDVAWALIAGTSAGPLKWISLTVTIVGSVMAVLAELFWKPLWSNSELIQKKTFPNLNGKWEGTLVSTWINPETSQPVPPISASITIRQGLFSTSVCMRTGESSSFSTRVLLEPHYPALIYRIWYSYSNEPQAQFQYRSANHEGIAFLELDFAADRNRLTGRYYTSRKTTGDIDMRRIAV
jgi:hypothetical protein